MKSTNDSQIVYILILAIAGQFVHLSINAQSHTNRLQNQNINYWELTDKLKRMQSEQLEPTINFIFQSRVISDSSFNAIRDCHVINKTQNTGTVTDANGEFKITAYINDSITFSAIGYEKLTIALDVSMYNYGYTIILKPQAYDLEEVTIMPYRLNLPPITKWEIYKPPLPNQGGINLLPTDVSPITALYNRYSREGKQRRHYKSVIDETAEYIRIGEKFNSEMVSQITGLKDDELVKFMSFCNFSKDFILNYSPETIRRTIRKKYEEYIEQFKIP